MYGTYFPTLIFCGRLNLGKKGRKKSLHNHKRYEPVCEKTNYLGSDKILHKPGCTVTEDGWRLEILDLESRGILLSV